MVTTHSLGFPRIGERRELKFALEKYWRGDSDETDLLAVADELKTKHWHQQNRLDFVPVGEFSLYDQVLDATFLVGATPKRIETKNATHLDRYFRLARGRAQRDSDATSTRAGKMVKWFNTNYHFIVPELTSDTAFKLNAERLIDDIKKARLLEVQTKPVIIGPLTFLKLAQTEHDIDPLTFLPKLVAIYDQLLNRLAKENIDWVQIDEPILATDLDSHWRTAFETTYHTLQSAPVKLLLTTYFGELRENLRLACELPVAGLHIDAIEAKDEVARIVDWLPVHKILSLGVINGRNIWKTDLSKTLVFLQPFADKLKDRLWLAPSCSLLHVPYSLTHETELDLEVKQWLAFANEKIDELAILAKALNKGRHSVQTELDANAAAIESRNTSTRIHQDDVKSRVEAINEQHTTRTSPFKTRYALQHTKLQLPDLPTTTIGSFPQTQDIRQTRRAYKTGEISHETYQAIIKVAIKEAIQHQESIGLDVLVHGEAERNDMVEYFGEQLEGFTFSLNGWVQSYGSRCVKPPIIYGDVSRPKAMTVDWTTYANTLTKKPVKGMLTGPVTILNWSFVRDDQPRAQTCLQIANAIRDEVLDLEKAGTRIIQIDEAALREGLPLRRSDWDDYLGWAIKAFRITANGVQDQTQIHTHMCYSEFNDILHAIADMDADVITIEASRSNLKLLDAFTAFDYPNAIGPGVYDIHSPNVPQAATMQVLIARLKELIPVERLWVNPDCGLKTRQWDEVIPALQNMVKATEQARCVPLKQ